MAKKGSGIMKPLRISEELQELLKVKKASRGEIMKLVWKHIKKYKLNDGRTINPDAKMAKVFGKKSFDMFKMAGKINDHIAK